MSQFQPALEYVLNFEDPDRLYETVPDNKGQVIAGINSLAWPEEFAKVDVISPNSARCYAVTDFYQAAFWIPSQLGGVTSQDVANRVLDHGVDAGLKMGVEVLQKAVNLLHPGSLKVDRLIGPLTIQLVNDQDPERLLAAIRVERANYYQQVVYNNPTDKPYLAEWLKRAAA